MSKRPLCWRMALANSFGPSFNKMERREGVEEEGEKVHEEVEQGEVEEVEQGEVDSLDTRLGGISGIVG